MPTPNRPARTWTKLGTTRHGKAASNEAAFLFVYSPLSIHYPLSMNLTRRRGAKAFFIVLGVCLTALAVVLNITWIQHNSGRFAMALLGFLLFAILIAGCGDQHGLPCA